MSTEMLADYHVHLGDSDPEVLLQEAAENSVQVLGGLDRGHVEAGKLKKMGQAAQAKDIIFLPSVECFATLKRDSKPYAFELVGIDFDLSKARHHPFFNLNGNFEERHQAKVKHFEGWLQTKGFRLDETPETSIPFHEVHTRRTFETAINICQIAALHPANKPLVEKLGLDQAACKLRTVTNKSFEAALAKVLYEAEFAFGQQGALPQPSAIETIENLHQIGALVSIAHPNFHRNINEGNVREVLENLVSLGVDGVEAWHAGPPDLTLVEFANRHGLVVTGGSDSDKQSHPGRVIGLGKSPNKDMHIPADTLLKIWDYKLRKGLI